MKATHTIKIKGNWYKAGEEIPAFDTLPVSTMIENPQVREREFSYTKTSISRMTVAELKDVANEMNINAEEKNATELKKAIIKNLGL